MLVHEADFILLHSVIGYLPFWSQGCQNCSKMFQYEWNDHIIQTKRARMFIFVSTTLFSHQRRSFLAFEDTSDNWLPKILFPGVPKWLQKWSKSCLFLCTPQGPPIWDPFDGVVASLGQLRKSMIHVDAQQWAADGCKNHKNEVFQWFGVVIMMLEG